MNLTETGKFIAKLRKQQGLSQEQLGEKLGVTNKTVSRWETGTYLPPAESLLAMSELFGVSINEILSGKTLSSEEYRQAAEENLAETVKSGSFSYKERLEFYKKKWLKEHIAVMVLTGIALAAIYAAGFVLRNRLFGYAFVFGIIFAHAWRNNAMMAYAEAHVYGD